ncbi:MAG: hypothetical protein FWF88_00740, partial [Peptococcaceae bacterium]|nr:hypothetical protein [Peptococcaceae bacterium]
MHELTIRISRAFCCGVFPQLNGELEADTALASNSATSGVGERQTPSASLPDATLKGEKIRGLLESPAHQTLPRDCYE